MSFIKTSVCLAIAAVNLASLPIYSQEREELVPFGDMEQWITREIKESLIIGGDTKLLYEIAPTGKIVGSKAYVTHSKSPWATSNVMAKVGVTKCSVSVFPEARGKGKAVRMDTRIENVTVLGIVDITVLAGGSVFLGGVAEPIKNTSNPQSKLITGIPFTKRPVAVRFDYKTRLTGEKNRQRVTGFSSRTEIKGADYPEVSLLLQKRWEDKQGNIYAKRIATAGQQFTTTVPDWVDDHTVSVHYGDLSKRSGMASFMQLRPADNPYYCMNKKGKMVPVQEIGWAEPDEQPTHIILRFSSSHGGPYVGSPGNAFWVDNVRLVY